MNPQNSKHDASQPEHYEPQASSSSSAGPSSYLDAYKVTFPLEQGVERPPVYHTHHNQQMMEESVVQEPPHTPYSPFILVSNLRAHLYVSLEKNGWLQKRIEELEEERNFLRCQLDRFIVSMRTPDMTEWCAEAQRGIKVRPPGSPPTSPMTTRSGMTLKRIHASGLRGRRNMTIPVKQEFHLEEDEYYPDDEYMEEEEDEDNDDDEDSAIEKGAKKKGRGRVGEPRMKMRRIFRITHGRERQRVKDPDGVLIRYKKILSTYQRVRSMSRAFQIHGVDRNTMASTSPIAELLLVAPEKVNDVGEFEASKEKLLDYARRCYRTMDEETHGKVQNMKKTHKLLPISYRFRN